MILAMSPISPRLPARTGSLPATTGRRGGTSGSQKIHLLFMHCNRHLSHAIDMAAITPTAHQQSDGHAYYRHKGSSPN